MFEIKTRKSSGWTSGTLPFPTSKDVGKNAVEPDSIDFHIVNFDKFATVPEKEEDRPLKISLLEEGLNESKPDGAQFKGITNPVAKNVKNKILQLVGTMVHSVLEDKIPTQESEALDWEFVGPPKGRAGEDDVFSTGDVELDNLYSSFANCAIDDFYAKLKKMKHPKDGSVSELFPDSPENLFFYTNEDLIQLLGDYEMPIHEEFRENYAEAAAFIGMNLKNFDQESPACGNQDPLDPWIEHPLFSSPSEISSPLPC